MNWYKELWSRIGGRPWTYIWRDIYHTTPVLIQALWFSLGALATWLLLTNEWALWWLAVVWGLYLFGFLQGHFHWGTKWQKWQEGK